MNLPNKQNEIKEILEKSGWQENRDISNQIKNTSLYKLLPQAVTNFISSFGGLKISKDRFEEINIIGIDFFNSPLILESFEENIYDPSKAIDTTNEDDEYYYSALIGKQIYFVAELKEGNNLMMDQDGRFYVHTFIPDFFWIANNPMEAFEQILFGYKDAIILNEKSLKWTPPIGQELSYYKPPINNKLIKNPWGE
ncbi:SUKH-3 domain-containing protein [Flavobacterium sp. MC2016-06]|jgi:hypothetical protein|uniref:SUKH-3 domain-containing protein n=1 Tax=Flavobacterium sp. MC2016-06 TaxID=2676308 RepID=UPI0012BAF968|nr:SUKH-3 domain-containing protein [Flavobacterium sp. MC2016-06]MBU3859859.1 SUKH-3 domain-containing protein [Flavobacterium sp. MC2016-06]